MTERDETRERQRYGGSRRWVIKLGSSLLTNDGSGLDEDRIGTWVDQIAALRGQGRDVVLVSSGAVAAGMVTLGWKRRPRALQEQQAAAAVGQMRLVQTWESCFERHGMHTAQVLLTYADLTDRRRYLNARSTLRALLRLGVVPVVNENDTVSNEELRFGDNDTLASLVANLVEAELMVILTDQQGLYDRDPRRHADAVLVPYGRADDPHLQELAAPAAGAWGRGGMLSKVTAAARASRSGAATVIAGGREGDVLGRIAGGEALGTLLVPGQQPLAARKQWINGHLQVHGRLQLDDGAVRVLRESGRSLLAVGVTGVQGHFERGDVVSCCDADGREVARGLVNYGADECRRIKGQASSRIEEILGYVEEPELIHRDNLVIRNGR
ncbi:MAG TPA: glutamate 5-kinase [Gammaproteobacteria bacterium]|nr:glutamate 5-kinase [Gammaproteobacteria bacterium]